MFSNLSALPENSKGRLYDEINDHRSLYERDRDRIYPVSYTHLRAHET